VSGGQEPPQDASEHASDAAFHRALRLGLRRSIFNVKTTALLQHVRPLPNDQSDLGRDLRRAASAFAFALFTRSVAA
jgi:hypothetical protein